MDLRELEGECVHSTPSVTSLCHSTRPWVPGDLAPVLRHEMRPLPCAPWWSARQPGWERGVCAVTPHTRPGEEDSPACSLWPSSSFPDGQSHRYTTRSWNPSMLNFESWWEASSGPSSGLSVSPLREHSCQNTAEYPLHKSRGSPPSGAADHMQSELPTACQLSHWHFRS